MWRMIAPLLAALLFVAIAFSARSLWQRLALGSGFDEFDVVVAENPDDRDRQLDALLALPIEQGSTEQKRRFDVELGIRASATLRRDLVFEIEESGGRKFQSNLGTLLERGCTVGSREFHLVPRLIATSPLRSLAPTLALATKSYPTDGSARIAVTIAENRIDKVLEIQSRYPARGIAEDLGSFAMPVYLDQGPPRVDYDTKLGVLTRENERLTIVGSDEVVMGLNDDTQLSRVRVRRGDAQIMDERLEGSASATRSFAHGLAPGESADFSVQIFDTIGLEKFETIHLQRNPKPAPQLIAFSEDTHGDLAMLKELSFSSRPIRFRASLDREDKAMSLFVESADLESPLQAQLSRVGDDPRVWAMDEGLDLTDQAGAFRLRLFADDGERRHELRDIVLRPDREGPRVLIHHRGRDLLDLPEIALEPGTEFELQIEDESTLRRPIVVALGGGLEALDAGQRLDGRRYRRRFRQATIETGTLAVETTDIHGQETTRSYLFVVTEGLPDDDGKGPEISLASGANRLGTETDNVLWQSDGKLKLSIKDPTGFRYEAISVTGATIPKGAASGFAADREIAIQHEEGPIVIDVADRFGNSTRRTFRITRIDQAPSLTSPTQNTKVGPLQLRSEALELRIQMRDPAPPGTLRFRVDIARGDPRVIPVESLNTQLEREVFRGPGPWILAIELQALEGWVRIHEVRVLNAP